MTTKQETAQLIAEKIDFKSAEEIEAMIQITSEVYGESIRAMVSNLYANVNPSVLKSGILAQAEL